MEKNDKIDDMLNNPSQWVDPKGPYSEVVFSSRIRLARNLANHRFIVSASKEEKQNIFKELFDELSDIDILKDGYFFDIQSLLPIEREFLIERHLVSYNLCFEYENGGVAIDKEENISVMVNEEDHLRIQGFAGGLQLFEIYDFINPLDDEIGIRVEYAFDKEFGYLTACPTNVGTGLRASVLIHLPALVVTRDIEKIIRKLRKKKIIVRGLFGEGSEVKGNFFQLSSSASIGRKEESIIALVSEVTKELVESERNAREVLMNNAKTQIEDKIWRAYGMLKYAHLLTTEEVLNLSSAVRLGVGLGIIRDVTLKQLNKLLIYLQPAHLQLVYNKKMDDYERDTRRALFVKEILSF
ncbi:MAG: protein arginine kinase [Candidatus Cloacimonas sp. 4484_209]|nr:MAG: protein arginine kinase [Candidatus Cloacimonas sp. 4484_209]